MELEAQFGYNYTYAIDFVNSREKERMKVGLTPEKLQAEKRKIPKPKKKIKKEPQEVEGYVMEMSHISIVYSIFIFLIPNCLGVGVGYVSSFLLFPHVSQFSKNNSEGC